MIAEDCNKEYDIVRDSSRTERNTRMNADEKPKINGGSGNANQHPQPKILPKKPTPRIILPPKIPTPPPTQSAVS